LRAHNRHQPWVTRLGYLPSEIIGACPVLPRWGLANSNENTILLAAYLRQAIILRGHHEDLKGGVEVLDDFARIINRLGQVLWTDMAKISRRNFTFQVDGETLRVKPLGRKLTIEAPEEATTFSIDACGDPDRSSWRMLGAFASAEEIQCEETVTMPIGLRSFTIEKVSDSAVPANVNGAPIPAGAFLRRLLTEGRDRLSQAFRK
jgi:hypothetical protein